MGNSHTNKNNVKTVKTNLPPMLEACMEDNETAMSFLLAQDKDAFKLEYVDKLIQTKKWRSIEWLLLNNALSLTYIVNKRDIYYVDFISMFMNSIGHKTAEQMTDWQHEMESRNPLKRIIEKNIERFVPELILILKNAFKAYRNDIVHFLSLIKIADNDQPLINMDICSYYCLLQMGSNKNPDEINDIINFYLVNQGPVSVYLDKSPGIVFKYFYDGSVSNREQFKRLLQLDYVPTSLIAFTLLQTDMKKMNCFVSDVKTYFKDYKFVFDICSRMYPYEHVKHILI